MEDRLQSEHDDLSTYYDEGGRIRSLFASLPVHTMLVLKVGAKVLVTQKLSNKIRNGAIGVVVGFREADDAEFDDALQEVDLPYGVTAEMVRKDYCDI